MKYYSQFGQDKFIYENVFNKKSNGFFLDIGASEPVDQNNTYFFEKLGWKGIVIEPRKEDFNRLKNERSCICENVAITSKREIRKFLQIDGPSKGLSGILEGYDINHIVRIVRELFQFGGGMELVDIECLPISDLLEKYSVSEVDYMSLDVEGMELPIIKTIDFDKVKIRCITVENNYENIEISNLLTSKGYNKVADLNCDEVYLLG
jgi:FkbM family methyltransferase